MANVIENPVPVLTTQAAHMRLAKILIALEDVVDAQLPLPLPVWRMLQGLQASEGYALLTPDMAQSMAAMDRYERRALSRRKTAIRAFDSATSTRRDPKLGDAGAGMP